MLVVTANWSIGDGTVHGSPPRGSVAAFLGELRRAAWRAGFGHDGRYRPLRDMQLVLAGDTFDGLTSLAWPRDVRPWQSGPRARDMAALVAANAFRQGRRLVAMLGRLRRDGLAVPQADARGRPLPGATRPASVSVVCLLGDRDRVLEGPWLSSSAARHGIVIGTEQASDALAIRHGAECDPLCGLARDHVQERGPTLGESLAIDLFAEFVRRLHAASMPAGFRAAIARRIATAPPFETPRHVAAWLASTGPARLGAPELAAIVREAWHAAIDHWHVRARATTPEAAVEHDVVDALAAWMEAGIRGAATGPHVLRPDPVIESLRPRIVAPAAGSVALVLGHPSPDAVSVAGKAVASCICLGERLHRGYAHVGRHEALPAVAFPDATIGRAEWLVRAGLDPDRGALVARIGAPRDEPGIVDAA